MRKLRRKTNSTCSSPASVKPSRYRSRRSSANFELPIQFGHEQLTSYGGLEVVRRYFHLIGLNARIRRALRQHGDGSDYGCTHLILLVVGLLVVGARRLKHLRYLCQ